MGRMGRKFTICSRILVVLRVRGFFHGRVCRGGVGGDIFLMGRWIRTCGIDIGWGCIGSRRFIIVAWARRARLHVGRGGGMISEVMWWV